MPTAQSKRLLTLLTPGEVAAIFRVNPKTVVRWCKNGVLRPDEWMKTGGGHHRIRQTGVDRLLAGEPEAIREKIEEARNDRP